MTADNWAVPGWLLMTTGWLRGGYCSLQLAQEILVQTITNKSKAKPQPH